MPQARSLKKHIAGVALAVLTLAAMPHANSEEVNMFDGQWHASVTPYLWLPTFYVSSSFTGPVGNPRTVSMDVTPGTYLSDLKFAAMITGELRKGDWSVFSDYIYTNLADSQSKVRTVHGPGGVELATFDTGSSGSLKASVFSLAGSYTAWRSNAGHFDVFVGTRYLGLDASVNWRLSDSFGIDRRGSVSKSPGYWDAIAGVKGEVKLDIEGRWIMPYYVDFGGGSNNTTWQALVGVGYRFGWGDVTLSLRNLSYRFTESRDTDTLRMTGPALSATFAF